MKEQILQILSDITGLEVSDFAENPDLNLMDSGILDSLSMVMLVRSAAEITGKQYTMQGFTPEDFTTVDRIVEALLR